MKTQKTHRRYPDQKWDYKAITVLIDRDTELIYSTLIDKGKRSEGVEIYTGENYVVGSKARSYSRQYTLSKLPEKYKKIVAELKNVHTATKWSKAKRVNEN